jgi:hypothetical protein
VQAEVEDAEAREREVVFDGVIGIEKRQNTARAPSSIRRAPRREPSARDSRAMSSGSTSCRREIPFQA